jgi:glucose/arabinose dehydrogenase
MFTGIFIKLFRLPVIIISFVLLVVMTMGTNTVSAQKAFLTRTGSVAGIPTPLDPAKISFQEIASGLTKPVFVTNAGDGSGRIFVIEQAGYIRILKNGSLQATPFLDIHTMVKSGGEQGLFALAFHPSYSTNGIFFVAYTAPRSGDATGSDLVLKRFSVSANNPDLADPGSDVVLLSISHPVNTNHNGGMLAFGGDGYLYWSTGDGGGGVDSTNNA